MFEDMAGSVEEGNCVDFEEGEIEGGRIDVGKLLGFKTGCTEVGSEFVEIEECVSEGDIDGDVNTEGENEGSIEGEEKGIGEVVVKVVKKYLVLK